jgi:hypothetical protein
MPRMPQTQRRELNNLQKGKIISLLDIDTSYAEIGCQTRIPAMIRPTYVLRMLAGVCKLRKIKFRSANKHGQGLYVQMDITAGFKGPEMSENLFKRSSNCSWITINRAAGLN